jgi:hypothetical protein
MTYSYTQISQYLRCPRGYRHRYLDGWREKEDRAALLFGRCFEKALAAYFLRQDSAAVLFKEWGANRDTPLEHINGDSWDRMAHQGVQLLEKLARDDRIRIRQPRRNLQAKLVRSLPNGNDFVAYIDAIGNLDGIRCVLDWKTTRSRYPEEPTGLLALDPQLICYSWMSDISDVAVVVFVRKRMRKTLPTFGARRLIREFDLPVSHRALERIWRAHGLMPKRRRKYQRKQDLAAIKATWRLFQQISADTKDLDSIPHFWPQAQRLRLPAVQYTARDVRSGLLLLAFAQRRSAAASEVFAARIQRQLDRYGVSLRDLVWQTDNGGEFVGRYNPSGPRTGFPSALGDSQDVRIPPARTPTRAMWKPCIGWSKTSSSTWKPSPAGASSWPRRTPISCTSTWCGPTRTRKTRAPGKSSSGWLPTRRSNSACFHRCSWITTSTTPGDTMSLGFPIWVGPGVRGAAAVRNSRKTP